tara:strand:+ start:719 stop:1864 length:1146 start_codon:yes stop_codon:yes gene_type:complete
VKQKLKQLVDISGNKLLGNPDQISGNIQEIQMGPEFIFSGNTMSLSIDLGDLDNISTTISTPKTESDNGKVLFYDYNLDKWTTNDSITHGNVVINAKKSTSGTIEKGKPVYLVGLNNDIHTVEEANADSSSTMPVIGFTTESINDTNSRYVMTYGKLSGLDTSTYSIGDVLYIDNSVGGLSTSRPTGGDSNIQQVAKVLKSDSTDGQLFIFNSSSVSSLPNLGTDKIWVGDVNGIPQQVDKSTLGGSGSGVPTLNDGQLFIGDNTNNAQSVDMSGDVNIDNTGITTIQPDSVTYDKIQDVSQASILGNQSGSGTVSEIPIVEQYLTTGVNTSLLEDTSNWDVNGDYIGSTITGTYQGQSHYNGNYWFTAVDDNIWIRLIRG